MVNDGSVDDSRNIALAFADADARFLAVDNPESGLVAANRFGISLASGRLMPPHTGNDPPLSPVPAPRGVTAMLCSWQ